MGQEKRGCSYPTASEWSVPFFLSPSRHLPSLLSYVLLRLDGLSPLLSSHPLVLRVLWLIFSSFPDEPDEVTFVKRALTQHLDMDPVVTLGVICDQIVPPDEPLDDEEVAIRDRLRSLVLAFLAGEAKRPLIERHANVVGSPAEQVLVSGLFKVGHPRLTSSLL